MIDSFAENPHAWATDVYKEFHETDALEYPRSVEHAIPLVYLARQLELMTPETSTQHRENAQVVLNGYRRLLEADAWPDGRLDALVSFTQVRVREEQQ